MSSCISGKKKKKQPPPPPDPGAYLEKLHLADNGIDCNGITRHRGLLLCMQNLREFITYSQCLQELDLFQNLIGNLGGRELLAGLEQREQGEVSQFETGHDVIVTRF